MLKELVSLFKGETALDAASQSFEEMINLAAEMVVEAGAFYWEQKNTPERRKALRNKDHRVNKLERKIRKAVIAHLSGPDGRDVPYGLLLMSIVKDIERIGDYAKNLADVPEMVDEPLPDDALVTELREIRASVERLAEEAPKVFASSDGGRASELTLEGRAANKRCDALVSKIARSDYKASVAVRLTLGARFYKRIQSHLLNLLSGVLMPLHKLDYYDEKYDEHASTDSGMN